MNWLAAFSWLAFWQVRRTRRAGDSDRADMGTAFGLDASFDAYAPRGTEAEAPVLTHWESRLVRRSEL